MREMQENRITKEEIPFQISEYVYREYEMDPDFPVLALVKEKFTFHPDPVVITWLHFHNCMEIMYCYEARLVNIENRIYYLEPGSVCVIPPNQMHNSRGEIYQETPEYPGSEYLYMKPERILGDFFTETYSFQHVFEQINRDLKNVISQRDNPKVGKLVRMLLDELREEKQDRYMIKGLFLSLWIELLRTLDLPSADHMAKRKELTEVYPAMVYVREHFAEQIATERLAEECHMSIFQFRKNFRKCVGLSPGEYITNTRLSKSCQFLLETESSILQVALACGFTSLSAYNRHFTERYGVSPSKWKKARRTIKKKTYSHSVYRQEKKEQS